MDFIRRDKSAGITTLVLSRGKVNALNGQVVNELQSALANLENDPETKAVIITGQGSFFSFGFDIPEFLPYSREAFTEFLTDFTELYTYMFMYPKPIIAALNGHTIAGGCMLVLACDRRIMVNGKSKISLNEITFGASVMAGSTEMLRFCLGSRIASEVLLSGKMYTAEEAARIGLIDRIVTEENLVEYSNLEALELGEKPLQAFTGIKRLLRQSCADKMVQMEKESIGKFVNIWYSAETRKNIEGTKVS